MGILRDMLGLGGVVTAWTEQQEAPGFGVEVDSGTLYGTPTLDDYIFQTGRISRVEALRVPAVKRARDLICAAIGQFPLRFYGPDDKVAETFVPNLFQQPETGIAPSITWTRVIEDLLLDGRAWLRVVNLGWHGRPVTVHKLDADTVTVQPEYLYYPEGAVKVWPQRQGLIRIDSPNAGLLDASSAVRACVALERASLGYIDGAPPIDYFTAVDGADPDDDDVEEFLGKWKEARRKRGTAYVPSALDYHVGGWDPEKLQLAKAREFAITEVARLTGLDAEDLSVSTTSRTYFNGQDRRRSRIEDVYGPYMTAVEGRMSMDDVSPRGFRAGFDTSNYLRADDQTAAQSDALLVGAQIITRDEARAKRSLEPLGAVEPAAVEAPPETAPLALPAGESA